MDKPRQFLRLTISSGEGDEMVRQVVIMPGAFETIATDEPPSLFAYRRALNALDRWAREHYPERADWKLIEGRLVRFPESTDA